MSRTRRRPGLNKWRVLRSPKIIALMYLSLIPLFAIVYTFFAEDFYHATAPYEESVVSAHETLADALLSEVQTAATASYGREHAVDSSLEIDTESIRFPRLDYEDDSFTLGFKLNAHLEGNSLSTEFYARVEFSVAPNIAERVFPTDPAKDRYIWQPLLVEFRPIGRYVARQSVLGDLDATILFPGNRLVLGTAIYQRLRAQQRAELGFPIDVNGSLPRMLYLSGVTITTVGYGDVLPTSDITRVLVMTEAVSGVLLAGLFLNAVARPRTRVSR